MGRYDHSPGFAKVLRKITLWTLALQRIQWRFFRYINNQSEDENHFNGEYQGVSKGG